MKINYAAINNSCNVFNYNLQATIYYNEKVKNYCFIGASVYFP